MQQDIDYRKLGGWLKVFYWLQFLALILLISLITEMREPDKAKYIFRIIQDITICLLSVYAALLVKKRNKKCIVAANIQRCVAGLFAFGRFFLFHHNIAELIIGLIILAVQVILWTLYFQRSERVKVYFEPTDIYSP